MSELGIKLLAQQSAQAALIEAMFAAILNVVTPSDRDRILRELYSGEVVRVSGLDGDAAQAFRQFAHDHLHDITDRLVAATGGYGSGPS